MNLPHIHIEDNQINQNKYFKLKKNVNLEEILELLEPMTIQEEQLVEFEVQNHLIPHLSANQSDISTRELLELLQRMNNNLLKKQRELMKKNTEIQKTYNTLLSDPLTSLTSKYAYCREINHLICLQPEKIGVFILLELLEIDAIKRQYGNRIGELYIVEFSQRLLNLQKESVMLIRLAETKFAIYQHGFSQSDSDLFETICEEIKTVISSRFVYGEITHPFVICGGGDIYIASNHDIETLVNNAEKALYWAKKCGNNQWKCF